MEKRYLFQNILCLNSATTISATAICTCKEIIKVPSQILTGNTWEELTNIITLNDYEATDFYSREG